MTKWAASTGTQAATVTTEHTLKQDSGANSFQAAVDLTNMVNGDITEIRVYEIINATARQIFNGCYANVQANPLVKTPIFASAGVTNGFKLTLKQTAGTSRNYDWETLADSTALDADVTKWNGTAVSAPSTAGIPEVNIKNIANAAVSASTAQLGVNVVNFGGAAGTFASGRPEVNTTHAAGTAWASGAITAASIAADAITAAKIAADAIGASELAADAATEIATAVWAAVTRTLTANTNLNDLSAAGVRAAVGMASANLDTQLSGINTKTTNLPGDPADASDIAGAFSTVNSTLATIAGYIDTEVAAIKAKTDNLPASPAAAGDAMALTAGERNSTADALLDRAAGVETSMTPRQALRIILAALAGKLSGAATTNIKIRDTTDSKNRIDATVDASGNRSTVTLDAS